MDEERDEERGVPSGLLKTEGGASRPTEGTPMLRILSDQADREAVTTDLDAIVREGARRMLLSALNAEVAEYLDAHAGERDGEGKALVVRNGVGQKRTVVTAAGGLQIEAPRVDDRREGRGSPVQSCRRGRDAPPRCPRCCLSCTCAASPPRISFPRSRSSSARRPA